MKVDYTDKMIARALFQAQVEPSNPYRGQYANTGQILKQISEATEAPESMVQEALNATGIIQNRLHSLAKRGFIHFGRVGHSYIWQITPEKYNQVA